MGLITLQIPQSGNPNSSEDPKITANFNILQSLLNGGIDYTNLSADMQSRVVAPTFSTYTPAWTNGTVGNGSITGRYIISGKVAFLNVSLTLGSTSASSLTANWFGLPAQAATGVTQVMPAYVTDGTHYWSGFGLIQPADTGVTPFMPDGVTGKWLPLTTSTPAGWVTASSKVSVQGFYITN